MFTINVVFDPLNTSHPLNELGEGDTLVLSANTFSIQPIDQGVTENLTH